MRCKAIRQGKLAGLEGNQGKAFANIAESASCVCCRSADHMIFQWSRFVRLSPRARHKEAKRLSLCITCLKRDHHVRECSSSPCHACQWKHHMLLHYRQSVQEPCPSENHTPGSSHMIPQCSSIMAVSSAASHSASQPLVS